ncbi:unnamed protein product [Calicophoron daubneyi]|uniref:Cytochrome c oxidase assembly factor 6 homolog n=1 Tax=Calicophoron daubneyi TaxID=300641 RepID=A0AAV2T916_CALDB
MSRVLKKAEREKCWSSRNAFWDCIDTYIKETGPEYNVEEANKHCSNERKVYESLCPRTWIALFDKQRDFTLFKAKKLEEELISRVKASHKNSRTGGES